MARTSVTSERLLLAFAQVVSVILLPEGRILSIASLS